MTALTVFIICGTLPAAYLLGSIPTGVLLTRFLAGKDIRRTGSGNIGATNVRRIAGNKLGAAALLGDMLKGAVPVYLAMRMHPGAAHGCWWELWVSLTVFGAFAGHLYPVYFKGRFGGKGVATAAGCFLIISPVAVAAAALVFVLVVWRRRMVSLGSLSAAAVLPVFVWSFYRSPMFSALAVIISVFIFYRHSGNIRRIREGTEFRL